MVLRCYCCKKRFESGLLFCPHCGARNIKQMDWIPNELKDEYCVHHKPIISSPTIEEIKTCTRQAAEECKFTIEDLRIEDTFEGLLEISQPEENYHKCVVKYNPVQCMCFTEDELMALLRHEIMHPVTIQEASKTIVSQGISQDAQDFQAEVQAAYDEMINYKEYVKRFPNDASLHSSRVKLYDMLTMDFLTTQHRIKNGELFNSIVPHTHALVLYEGTVCNFFEKEEHLDQWVKKYNAGAMQEFWKWVHQDFNLIHDETSSRDEMRKIIFLTVKMATCVSVYDIYDSNKLLFNEAYGPMLDRCKNQFTDSLAKKLINLWEERYKNAPYKF